MCWMCVHFSDDCASFLIQGTEGEDGLQGGVGMEGPKVSLASLLMSDLQ